MRYSKIPLFKKNKKRKELEINKRIRKKYKLKIKKFPQLSVISHSILTSHKKIKIIIIIKKENQSILKLL